MGCCGAGSHEPKQNNNFPQNNNSSAVESSGDSTSPVKKIFTWGLVIVVIVGMFAWHFVIQGNKPFFCFLKYELV